MNNKFKIDQEVFVLSGSKALKTTVVSIHRSNKDKPYYVLENAVRERSDKAYIADAIAYPEEEIFENEKEFRAGLTIVDYTANFVS